MRIVTLTEMLFLHISTPFHWCCKGKAHLRIVLMTWHIVRFPESSTEEGLSHLSI